MKVLSFYLIFFFSLSAFGQNKLDSLGHFPYLNGPHQTKINDVWGYVDELGNEYALVGTENGVSIVNVNNPSNPYEVFWFPDMHSIWRDLKVWNDYLYVTTEAQAELLIIDLSPLPASNNLPYTRYSNGWKSAHNIYIDENGFAYIFGPNRGNQGVIILDVASSPMNPVEVGTFDNWYVHDGYVRNDTLYLAHILDGFLSIVDVSNKNNPILLGTKTTPSNFTHNIWPSDNGQYVFTTDEVVGGYIGAYDITDVNNIIEVDRIQSSPDVGYVIPHNVHVKNDFLITSYYSDGVVIHDASRPYNLIEVGYFDTYPQGQTSNYNGCWGTYPFLPSGIILATDRDNGLFILGNNYGKACYLEGTITDAVTNNPVQGVDVNIQNIISPNSSNNLGFYATGVAASGNYTVTYSKVGYFSQTKNLTLSNGQVTIQDIQLTPITPFSLIVNVFEKETGNPVLGADVRLKHSLITHDEQTNGIGQAFFQLYYEDNYDLITGKWKYQTQCEFKYIDQNTGEINIYLEKKFFDDFSFDFGWTVSSTATTGKWERGKPFNADGNSFIKEDVSDDCGELCFITGNKNTYNGDADDVDNGTTTLRSPIMDLTTFEEPILNYSRWFYCHFGPGNVDDTLRVFISNGNEVIELDKIGPQGNTPGTWVNKSFNLKEKINLSSTMQLIVEISDLDPDVNITEAGFDYFSITEKNELVSSIESFIILPNPVVNNLLQVNGVKDNTRYMIYSIKGKTLMEGTISKDMNTINLYQLSAGVYFIKIENHIERFIKM